MSPELAKLALFLCSLLVVTAALMWTATGDR